MTAQKEVLEAVQEIADGGYEILLADGFEGALLGTVIGACRQPVACYDYMRCVEILMERDGMSAEGALEHMEFNVVGAYVGEGTPLFLCSPRYLWSAPVDVEAGQPADSA